MGYQARDDERILLTFLEPRLSIGTTRAEEEDLTSRTGAAGSSPGTRCAGRMTCDCPAPTCKMRDNHAGEEVGRLESSRQGHTPRQPKLATGAVSTASAAGRQVAHGAPAGELHHTLHHTLHRVLHALAHLWRAIKVPSGMSKTQATSIVAPWMLRYTSRLCGDTASAAPVPKLTETCVTSEFGGGQ